MSANLENSAVVTELEKVSFIPISKKGNAKHVQTTVQLCSFHMLVRLCSKSFKLGVSSTWTQNFQMYKLGLKGAEETDIKLLTFIGSWGNQGNSRRTYTSASLTMLKPLCGNCGKFLKRWEYQTTLPASWETCMWVKKQHLEPDTEQLSGLELGKECDKAAVYCHPAYLTYLQSTSCKMLG